MENRIIEAVDKIFMDMDRKHGYEIGGHEVKTCVQAIPYWIGVAGSAPTVCLCYQCFVKSDDADVKNVAIEGTGLFGRYNIPEENSVWVDNITEEEYDEFVDYVEEEHLDRHNGIYSGYVIV